MEVIVVVGIIAFISSIMLANFPNFRREVTIDREAARMTQTLRKAQFFALAVREFGPAPNYKENPFCDAAKLPPRFPPYGASFAKVSASGGRGPQNYLIFGDINCNEIYDNSVSFGVLSNVDEKVENFPITGTIRVEDIIGVSSALGCPAPSGCKLNQLDILYRRPNPVTSLTGLKEDNSPVEGFDSAEITLGFAENSIKKTVVIIRATGQIGLK